MRRKLLLVGMALAMTTSLAAGTPMTNVAFEDNEMQWFTFDNLRSYEQFWESHDRDLVIFSAHPSYAMQADNVRLLYDMSRAHYLTVNWANTTVRKAYYRNLTRDLSNGHTDYVITRELTTTILAWNESSNASFEKNYCRVDNASTQQLFNRTAATLYEYCA